MALSVNVGDAFVAGQNISVTINGATERPSTSVRLDDGVELDAVLRLIDDQKYNLRFLIPANTTGHVEITVKSGSESEDRKIAVS